MFVFGFIEPSSSLFSLVEIIRLYILNGPSTLQPDEYESENLKRLRAKTHEKKVFFDRSTVFNEIMGYWILNRLLLKDLSVVWIKYCWLGGDEREKGEVQEATRGFS